MRSLSLLFLSLVLGGCEEEEDPSHTTGIELGDLEPVIPRKGQWYYDVWEWTAQDCGITNEDLPIDTEDGFKIPEADPEDFNLKLENDVQMNCKITGDSFLCAEVSTSSSYSDGLVQLDIVLQTEGHFPHYSFMIGHHQLYMSCDGQGCDAVEAYFGVDFPCEAGIDFNAFHE